MVLMVIMVTVMGMVTDMVMGMVMGMATVIVMVAMDKKRLRNLFGNEFSPENRRLVKGVFDMQEVSHNASFKHYGNNVKTNISIAFVF